MNKVYNMQITNESKYDIIRYYTKKEKYVYLPIIQDKIEHIEFIYYEYKKIDVKITVVSYDKDKKINQSFIDSLKYYTNGTIDYYIRDIYKETENHTLNILIALNHERKLFPSSNIINTSHANNGLTTFFEYGKWKYIYIYRIEDLYKVLIHEIIHYFNKDIKNDQNCLDIVQPKIPSLKSTWIDSRGTINFNEAYVEAMAIYLYCMISNKNIKKYITRGMRVAKALIKHANKYPNGIIQYTNVLSYYIYRAALLLHLDELIALKNCKDSIILLEKSIITFNSEINNYKPLSNMMVIEFIKNVFQ